DLFLQLQREGGKVSLVVGDLHEDAAGGMGKDIGGEGAFDREPLNPPFREEAGGDDQAQEHRQDEIQQVVAGIYRGKTDGKGDENESATLRRKPEEAVDDGDLKAHSLSGFMMPFSR